MENSLRVFGGLTVEVLIQRQDNSRHKKVIIFDGVDIVEHWHHQLNALVVVLNRLAGIIFRHATQVQRGQGQDGVH